MAWLYDLCAFDKTKSTKLYVSFTHRPHMILTINCHLFCFHRLPVFKEEDRQLVKGTYDFFAISHFSTKLVTHAKEDS